MSPTQCTCSGPYLCISKLLWVPVGKVVQVSLQVVKILHQSNVPRTTARYRATCSFPFFVVGDGACRIAYLDQQYCWTSSVVISMACYYFFFLSVFCVYFMGFQNADPRKMVAYYTRIRHNNSVCIIPVYLIDGGVRRGDARAGPNRSNWRLEFCLEIPGKI